LQNGIYHKKKTQHLKIFNDLHFNTIPRISVADLGCLFRIPDPDFYPSRVPDLGSRISDPGSRIPDPGSRIPDLGSTNSNKSEIFVVKNFFVATNFTKLKIIFFLNAEEKNWASIQKEL
jgi:hypothetical protein